MYYGKTRLIFIFHYRSQRSCGKVMFLHLSLILFIGEGLCQGDPLDRDPLWTETPLNRDPPGQSPPPDRDLLDRNPPPPPYGNERVVRILLVNFAFLLPNLADSAKNLIICKYLILRETYLAAHCNNEFTVIFSTTEPLSDWPGLRLLYLCCKIYSFVRIRSHEIKMKTRIDISEKIMIITSLSCTSFNV